jgi:hypothetical protein
VCCDSDPITLSDLAVSPGGGVFTISGQTVTTFTPDCNNPGDFTFTYTYVDPDTQCENFCTFTISVYLTPDVDDIPDQVVCDSYTLPAITGTNLSGNQAFYTGSGGTGTMYTAGSIITTDITLYIYDETGTTPNCFDEEMFTIDIVDPSIETYVYLEGSAIDAGGTETYSLPMRTDLNDLFILPGQAYEDFFAGVIYSPPGQPYNTAPWNYPGTEGSGFDSGGTPGDAGYPTTVVDWVLVSLRATPTGAPLCTKAALLHQDGTVEFVDDDQNSCLCSLDLTASYYILIEHRNHLVVMSPEPVAFVNGVISFDFRASDSYNELPFLPFVGQKEILPGVWAMFGSNGSQIGDDVDITGSDRAYWQGENNTIGLYRTGDYNLNGDVNYNDRKVWEFNNGLISTVIRY